MTPAEFAQLSTEEQAARRKDVRVLILTGLGLNCEAETDAAFKLCGARTEQVHLLDLLDGKQNVRLADFSVLALIGGFAFGDHLGGGSVFANKIRFRLYDQLIEFIEGGGLALGICNGFQTMTRLGLLPGFDGDYRTPQATLAPNDRLGYRDAWIELGFDADSPCLWTRGLERMPLPTRHGEGKFLTANDEVMQRLIDNRQIAARYIDADGQPTQEWPQNPNGSPHAIAGVCDPTGRLFGLMPHPDAYLYAFHHPHWMRRDNAAGQPMEGEGLRIFQNGVDAAAMR